MRVILLLLCLVSVALKAQQMDYPIDTIEGKPYYRYTVEKGVVRNLDLHSQVLLRICLIKKQVRI